MVDDGAFSIVDGLLPVRACGGSTLPVRACGGLWGATCALPYEGARGMLAYVLPCGTLADAADPDGFTLSCVAD